MDLTWDRHFKSYIFDAVETFIEVNTISTKSNSLWKHFSSICQKLIDEHVQSKMTSVRHRHILINTEINRRSSKASKNLKILGPLCIHQKQFHIECHNTHNNYVSTMLSEDIKSNPNRLCHMVIHNKAKDVIQAGLRHSLK